jgi:Methyltransferase domain
LKLRRRGQLLWWLVRNPIENSARMRERLAERRAGWRPELVYRVDEEWELRLHGLLGAPAPCPDATQFSRRWDVIVQSLAERGLSVGRAAYGGWDDADPALARAAWCLTRHLRPQQVVETGVGRGFTSRVVLEALQRNGGGHIWSVDQPPPLSPNLRRQIAVAVPDRLKAGWTCVRGSSRHRLPHVIRELECIDLFIHDSMHTTRNVLFELEAAWPALQTGGAMLVDDIDVNRGFELFVKRHRTTLRALVGISDDRARRIGVILKDAGSEVRTGDHASLRASLTRTATD